MLLGVEIIEEFMCKLYKSSMVVVSMENIFDMLYDLRW